MTMRIGQILERIDQGIDSLVQNDHDLLVRRINEPTISSRLADYLRPLFEGYDVDAEYNGDIDNANDKKALEIASKRLLETKNRPNLNNTYKIEPDIIIHRGTNEYNLVAIEIKKDVSPRKYKEYDLIKLEHLTINHSENHYNYRVGIAIVFGTAGDAGKVTKTYLQEGIRIDQELLK